MRQNPLQHSTETCRVQHRVFCRNLRGFSLVELLVVVALIALLFSLVGVAAMSAMSGAKIKATQATILKIQGILQQRLDAITRSDPDKVFVDSLTPRFQGNKRRAETMARKFTFRQAFPQSWPEIQAYYPKLLITSNESVPAATAVPRPQESAEVLYFMLTKANVLGYPPESTDAFSSSEVRDTDNPPNGKLEFVDAWGRPLRFYRWPTRLIRCLPTNTPPITLPPATFTPNAAARALIPSLPTSAINLNRDTDDPYGVLGMKVWGLSTAEAEYFEQGTAPAGHFLRGMGPFHTLDTFTLPLVVSPGADGLLGLYEPGDSAPTSTFGYLAAPIPAQGGDPALVEVLDNISNYNVRSGGK